MTAVVPDRATPVESDEQEWHRHPADVARLVVALLVTLGLVFWEAVEAGALRRVASDTVDLFDRLPSTLVGFLLGTLQLLATLAPLLVLLSLVARRRWRLLGTLAVAAGIGATVMAGLSTRLTDTAGASIDANLDANSWFTGAAYPSSSYLAGLTAVVTVAAPALRRPWRRTAWAAVAVVALVRLLTATIDPFTIGFLVALGSAAGSAVLVAFGARRRRIDVAVVEDVLSRCGIEPASVEVGETGPGTPVFEVQATDGERVRVSVLGRDERDTDLLIQIWRWLQVRGLGDPRPPESAQRVVERAALAAGLADASGARVARPVLVARTDEGAAVLGEQWVEGPRLDEVDPAALTDDVLQDLWRQVDRLHARGLAHQGLTGNRVVLADDGPTLVWFRAAGIDATERERDADVAQLLVETALRVGAAPAVDAAHQVLGADALGRALPLLQPVVLQPSTRSALKDGEGDLLEELRTETQQAAGVEAIELAKVRRIDLKSVVSLVGGTVLGYYVISLASDWADIWDTLRTADWSLIPLLLVLMALQYVAGALGLMGSVNQPLALGRSTQIMYAQSFLNRFTPANAGGMALRTRYLQKSGIDLTVAASAVGLTSVASGIVQVVFLILCVTWANTSLDLDRISLPSGSVILVVAVAIGALVGVVLASTWGRQKVRPWLSRTWADAWGNLRELGRDPSKMGLLLGGPLMSKVVTMGAFVVSARALGVSTPLSTLAGLYMVATTVGGAVPTPGGVGGIEAALTAALTAVGIEPATAASIVLLFRLITFWLPVLPGWWFLRRVQNKGYV